MFLAFQVDISILLYVYVWCTYEQVLVFRVARVRFLTCVRDFNEKKNLSKIVYYICVGVCCVFFVYQHEFVKNSL